MAEGCSPSNTPEMYSRSSNTRCSSCTPSADGTLPHVINGRAALQQTPRRCTLGPQTRAAAPAHRQMERCHMSSTAVYRLPIMSQSTGQSG
eukprot:4413188-Pyramimonas_sp.AAC.1